MVDTRGREIETAPRALLRPQTRLAAKQGYDVRLATELEFYVFANSLRTARKRHFRHLEPTTSARLTDGIAPAIAQQPFLQAISEATHVAGIPVGSAQTEAGRGQWEVNLPHSDPISAADNHLVFKPGVKELARQFGHSVTFMARPVRNDLGSSCHIHCSLFASG